MTAILRKRAYTIDEHCEMWRYGRNTAYNEIAKGELDTIKVGRRRLIPKEREEYCPPHLLAVVSTEID